MNNKMLNNLANRRLRLYYENDNWMLWREAILLRNGGEWWWAGCAKDWSGKPAGPLFCGTRTWNGKPDPGSFFKS